MKDDRLAAAVPINNFLCPWQGLVTNGTLTNIFLWVHRYAINDAATDWSTAEAHVTKLTQGKAGATVVSVKSGAALGQKRKAEAGEEEGGGKKATRRGKKAKR